MKRIVSILVLLLCFILLLSSCSKKQYESKDYILNLDYKDDFKILQLSDIHLANKDNRQLHYDFIDLTINDAAPDLIILTGDSFTFADKALAKEFFAWLDSHNIPWTLTFGNHDEQCYFPIDWLTNLLNNYGSNCVFKDIQDDNIFGNSNFAIDLNKDGKTFYQLIIMDSNRYCYGGYFGYDTIKEDQIKWYEDLVNYTKEQNGELVPSLLFFHIPLPEFDDAWEAAQKGEATLEFGDKQEPSCPPKVNTGFFNKIEELGSTKGIMVGHDHINNFRILYKGIYFCYGVNSTDRIYYDNNLLGGHVITIHNDKTLSFDQIYHTYEEVTK